MTEIAPSPRVDFPEVNGARSTSAVGRAVVSDALAPIDPVGARSARAETNWRSGYLPHFRRLIEAGLDDPEAAVASVHAGLASVQDHLAWVRPDGTETPIVAALDPEPAEVPQTLSVDGSGQPIRELVVPYQGRDLRGTELSAQLDRWVLGGVMEPSAAEAVRAVLAHPEWLALPDRIVVALGAGSEIGPTPTLLSWGATVAGLDLPREQLWARVLDHASKSAGRLLVPRHVSDAGPDRADPRTVGLDLLTDLPRVDAWLQSLPETDLVFGNYVYADGGTNLRLSAASDALATRLTAQRPSTVLAWMATPTDVFAVPSDAVAESVRTYEERGRLARGPGRLLRGMTGGRLLARAYLPGSDPGLCDSLVPQQGPNYALGKRIHRWRATAEQSSGRRVSMNVAPPTRTVSVVRNKALAAAYAGAHRFGVEVFEPETTRVLMAALLVHDLMAEEQHFDQPWHAEAANAVHGGLWRAAYAPRSALGLAAVLGYGSVR